MKDRGSERNREGGRECPFCGSEVHPEAIKCRVCHSMLNSKAAKKRENLIKSIEKQSFIKCVFCAEEIPDYVLICKHCLEKVKNKKNKPQVSKSEDQQDTEGIKRKETKSEKSKESEDSEESKESKESKKNEPVKKEPEKIERFYLPSWQMALLSILTLNIYQVYWFYRNWKFMKLHLKLQVHPILNVILFIIPVFGFIEAYRQFSQIDNFSQNNKIQNSFYPAMVFLLWLVFLLEGMIFPVICIVNRDLNILAIVTLIISLLSIFPLTIVQNVINLIIKSQIPESETGFKLRIINIVFLLFGLAAWFFLVYFLKK